MRPAAVLAWVLTVAAGLRKSQANTLADLVTAALGVGRASLAALSRRLAGGALCKHRIKRAWRFCANQRVHVGDAMAGVIDRLARRGGGAFRQGVPLPLGSRTPPGASSGGCS